MSPAGRLAALRQCAASEERPGERRSSAEAQTEKSAAEPPRKEPTQAIELSPLLLRKSSLQSI